VSIAPTREHDPCSMMSRNSEGAIEVTLTASMMRRRLLYAGDLLGGDDDRLGQTADESRPRISACSSCSNSCRTSVILISSAVPRQGQTELLLDEWMIARQLVAPMRTDWL